MWYVNSCSWDKKDKHKPSFILTMWYVNYDATKSETGAYGVLY